MICFYQFNDALKHLKKKTKATIDKHICVNKMIKCSWTETFVQVCKHR